MKRFLIPLFCLLSAAAFGQVTGTIPSTGGGAACVNISVGSKASQIAITVTGTWSGTLQPEISVQGQATANTQVTPSTSSTAASTITANGTYFTVNVAGADTFLLCGNTVSSGTANVYLNISTAGSVSKGASSTVGTVTNVATTAPITGGPITATGTIACATCAIGPGSSTANHLAKFSGTDGVTLADGGAIPAGTVSSVTFTGDGVVESSTPSSAVTTTGTVTATLATAGANTVLGNATGGVATPAYGQIVAAQITSGTITGTQIASSIALAGSPTTTTQSASDNSTKIATTAYVDRLGTGPTYSQASTPTAPTLATVGSAGSTSITYKVVGCQDTACTLHTAASAGQTIASANGTLSSSNYVTLTTYKVHLDGAQCYNIYRTATNGTSPTTTGKIASCVGQEYSDQGAAGDSGTAPATNTTILASNPMPLPGCAIAIGGYTDARAPQCTPNEADDDFGETGSATLALDPRWTTSNYGTSTTNVGSGGLSITSTQAGNVLRILHQSIPSPSGSYTYSAYVCDVHLSGTNAVAGLELDDGTKIEVYSMASTNKVQVDKWTNSTTFSSTVQSASGWGACGYIQVANNATNINISFSADGRQYTQYFTEAKGTFFTTQPTNVGFAIQDGGNPEVLTAKFLHKTQ